MDIPVIDPFGIAADPKMPFLRQAINPSEVRCQFERHVSYLREEKGKVNLNAIRVTRYKPQRRCLVEYDLEFERPPEKLTVIGKARAKGVDKATYHILTALWNAGFRADNHDGIHVPEPMGIIPGFNMLLQRKASGIPVTQPLSEQGGVVLAQRIAEAAHKLHKTYIPVDRTHTIEDELHILHEYLAMVAQMKPQWEKRLDRVLESCDRLGASIPTPITCGIHRDFYQDQVIVDGPSLYLVDFDLYCKGDPGLDIGNFLGHLTELSLRTCNNPMAMADVEEALEERFVALSGEHTLASVQAYTTLTLVRHIYISTQFIDRRQFTETLLELCEQRLSTVQP